MEKTNFNFIKGDTYTRGFTIENFDHTIEQVYFTVKESTKDRMYVLQKTLNNGIEIDPDISNRYIITIDADDTNGFKTGKDYVFDVEIITAPIKGKAIKRTIIGGNFNLDDWDVTSKRNEV